MKELAVHQLDKLSLEMPVPGHKTERLAITNGTYFRIADYRDAQLFQDLATMHMVAPYLPDRIKTDFPISKLGAELIGKMYDSCGRRAPEIPRQSIGFPSFDPAKNMCMTKNGRAVVAYSAGKDSLWNMSWAMKEYGPSNVMAVHINGLNRSCGAAERTWSQRQSRELEFPLRTVDLRNSSSNAGYGTMRSRDLFLIGLLVPLAAHIGARHIITEGFAEAKRDEPFSGQAATMRTFNTILMGWGYRQQVIWRDKLEMDIIREMYETRPEWMPLMSNCFSMPNYKLGIRRSWKRNAPTFLLYESQCGSCVKCRITNVARILYDTELQKKASVRDILIYLKSTAKWTHERYKELYDMLEGSFMRDLEIALQKYGLDAVRPR